MTRVRRRLVGNTVAAVLLAGALGGCGEVTNTITPKAGTANELTVELNGTPNADLVGVYEA
jgi:hypothetical protein